MAYKGRRVKKKPIYKKPAFWIAILAVVLILLLVGWVWKTLSDEVFTIRKPDETTLPTSQEKPEETTEATLPPPEANPYGELDFQYDGRFLKLIHGESIAGIDVSSWQYDIDWEAVADAGAEFAMIRIGYRGSETGKLNPDKYAQANLEGAAAAGLDIGVYFSPKR